MKKQFTDWEKILEISTSNKGFTSIYRDYLRTLLRRRSFKKYKRLVISQVTIYELPIMT